MKRPGGKPEKIFILTGSPGSGKSTYLAGLLEKLEKRGIVLKGFIAPSEGQRSYLIRDLQTGADMPLSSRDPVEGWTRTGSFFFNPDALKMGNGILVSAGTAQPDLIVVDEVGPFELKGLVWHDALTELKGKCTSAMLWVVREQIIEEVASRWALDDPVVLNPSVQSMEQAFRLILSVLGKGNNWSNPEIP